MNRKQPNPTSTTLLQWNCRGLKQKAASLTQFLTTLDSKPAVIALQETNSHMKLPGYVAYGSSDNYSTLTLIRSTISAVNHVTPQRGCNHVLTELLSPSPKNKLSLYILNIYCRPTQKVPDILSTIRDAINIAGTKPLLILGDFNAAHPQWGYRYKTKRGTLLAQAIDDFHLLLLNHPGSTTRMGTSTARDTSPDLSLLLGTLDVLWSSTGENLGSDHDIIELTIRNLDYNVKTGVARLTNWDAFRKANSSRPIDPNQPLSD